MLVSDKYRFIVACPTKTGTNSMRAVAEKWKRKGGDPSVLKLLKGEASTRHRIAPPPGCEDYARYMMVRDPYDRMVSMYEYLRRKDWEWMAKRILADEDHKGREFAWIGLMRTIETFRSSDGYMDPERRKAHGGRPFMWTDTLYEMAQFMRGWTGSDWPRRAVGHVRLESVEDDWHKLLADHGVTERELYEIGVSHRNSTRSGDKLFGDPAAYWEVRGASIMSRVIGLDVCAEELGYPVRFVD